MTGATDQLVLHATTIAVNGHAALIRGPSGSGKSGLALQLIAMGAALVADDRTILNKRDEQVFATAPDPIKGQIEARGIGLLAAPTTPPTPLRLIVDLEHEETDRLPPLRHDSLLGVRLPVIRKTKAAHFPAAILLYLQGNRIA
ncbi:HPr kinase/phosphorylase [Roseovarius sp. 2305UL8-3]|uniref:HPr kinase/phosphorylase n=1 Tax=Roseovarius conchicola TaxID=3121636 RepID=UPI0035286A96